jgi:RHS repeat-associated protein
LETFSNPFRFTGREFDAETDLYFYRARYYDPSIGRFISEDPIRSEDPISFDAGTNFYTYVQNNPVNTIDPFGLAGITIDAGGGIGIGGYTDSKSVADSAATGLYIGVKKGGHAELGAYTHQSQTKIGGGKATLGISLTIYYEDAEKVLGGKSYIDVTTFGPVSHTWIYDECGNKIGRSLSLWGVGGGASFERGKSEGIILPLQ